MVGSAGTSLWGGRGAAPSRMETKRAGHRNRGVGCFYCGVCCFRFSPVASKLRKLSIFKDIIPVQFCFMLDLLWFDISVLRSALLKLI